MLTDVSTTLAEAIIGHHHLASAQVVETSVNTNNSPSEDYTTNPDDHSKPQHDPVNSGIIRRVKTSNNCEFLIQEMRIHTEEAKTRSSSICVCILLRILVSAHIQTRTIVN